MLGTLNNLRFMIDMNLRLFSPDASEVANEDAEPEGADPSYPSTYLDTYTISIIA